MRTLAFPLLLAVSSPVPAQEGQLIDPRIAALTQQVDPDRLQRTITALVACGTRHVASSTEGARGTGAARRWLEQELGSYVSASGGRLQVSRQTFTVPSRRLGADVELVNVVATLPGTSDPDRIYVIGGHYDSINSNNRDAAGPAPGANDDASGTAAAVEACRVLSTQQFAATILFVCYDGEELGLLGSTWHAKQLGEAGARVDGMITNDIVGNTLGMDGVRRREYLRCFSYATIGNDSPGRSLARAARAASRFVDGFELRLVWRGDRYGRGGDHRPFHAEGFPAVRFTEPREDYSRQHKNVTERDGQPYGDVLRFIDFPYLANVCRVDVALLAELAAAPPAPARARARGARDAYDTLLSWAPVDGATAYEAVSRQTTATDWQRIHPIDEPEEGRRGMLQTRLVGVCLDEVVVGVRALGKDGARSRVTTPPEPDAVGARPRRR